MITWTKISKEKWMGVSKELTGKSGRICLLLDQGNNSITVDGHTPPVLTFNNFI